MPRIELKVEAHRRARERIDAGKPVWDRRVDIKPIIKRDQSDTSEETAAKKAVEIAALLRAKLPVAFFDITSADYEPALDEAVEDLETLTATSFSDDPNHSTLKALNGRLEEIYDWADGNSVWLGA
jgi:hypothetical protein